MFLWCPQHFLKVFLKQTAFLSCSKQQVQSKVVFPNHPRVSNLCKILVTKILAPLRVRIRMAQVKTDAWLHQSSHAIEDRSGTSSRSWQTSTDSDTVEPVDTGSEQETPVQLVTKEGLKATSNTPSKTIRASLEEESIATQDPRTSNEQRCVRELACQVLLDCCPSPKQMLGVVHLVQVILQHFGGLMAAPLQRYVLRVLTVISAFVAGIFQQRDSVHVGFVPSLKSLRSSCMDSLSVFFERFTQFPWRSEELHDVLEVFVCPQLSRLPSEGLLSPTPLLKLFSTWSSHPRYFPLLVRHRKDDPSYTPLPFIMALLLQDKTSSAVRSFIWDILERLLTVEGVEDEEEEVPLPMDSTLPVREEEIQQLNLSSNLNYGSQILMPHVGEVLRQLLKQLENKQPLKKTEVVVLSRVTELASTQHHSEALLRLLLRLLSDRKRKWEDDELVSMVLTVRNLVGIVPDAFNFTRSLAVLFSTVQLIPARKVLLEVLPLLDVLGADHHFTLLLQLNAFSHRWVDQPDFDTRLDAYKKVQELLEDRAVSLELGLMILHNSFSVIRVEKDLSFRDSATHCLCRLGPALADSLLQGSPGDSEVWVETVLGLVRSDMLSKEEHIQSAAISLLGTMTRDCVGSYPVLRDLTVLACKADPEVDFFENARHLQIYRRLRSLQRFCSVSKTLVKPPSPRTLTQFILPLATQYLCAEKYAGKNSLVDSAIECVAAVCRMLPWHQYLLTLRYYISKLKTCVEHQRQLVRLVTAILDSFHYDITTSSNGGPAVGLEVRGADESKAIEPVENTENEPMVVDILADEEGEKMALEDEAEKMGSEMADKKAGEVEEETRGLAMERVEVLRPGAAARVERAIRGYLLAELKTAIGQRTLREKTHKFNLKNLGPDKDDEDMLRIPLAIALVKLLQKLPGGLLDQELPGIFMSLSTFLKSRLQSVRLCVRETLQHILVAVSPRYLDALLQEMTALLLKGFHTHVLAFTAHAVVQSVSHLLQPGDIDRNLPVLLEVCKSDLFGAASEEKDVSRIQVKHTEARSSKSYHLVHVAAQHVTASCLTDLLLPFQQVVMTSHSHKTLSKCRECLRQVSLGLALNAFIPPDSLLQFLYGVVSESIPELMPVQPPPPKKHNPRVRADCLLLPEQPRSRTGVSSNVIKCNKRSNAHIMVEFGLDLLLTLLKKEKLKNLNLKEYLDPLVPVLSGALTSQHVKVTTLTLQCLARILRLDLPSLRADISTVTAAIFSLLHKYGAAGLSKGDNFDLVQAAFKVMSVLVREVDYHKLEADQLKLLLLYTEQDLNDHTRQATAFTMLKAILKRKFASRELGELMDKVAALSVTSEAPHVRTQARQAVLQYVMDYPLGAKLDDIVGFYLSQLAYDVEAGRQSALEMVLNMINAFPEKVLEQHSGVLFLTVGARLVNDDTPDGRRMVAAVVKTLLTKLHVEEKSKLFDIVLVWLKQKKVSHKRLAAQLAGLFTSVEKASFSKRLPVLLPVVQAVLCGDLGDGRFVRPLPANNTCHVGDHLLFQVMQLVLKVAEHCPDLFSADEFKDYVDLLTETSQSLLCHPHEWVRLSAAQFLGSLFTYLGPEQVAAALDGRLPSGTGFLDPDSVHSRVKSLVLDHCAQLVPGVQLTEDFLDQTTKNLVFFARVLKNVSHKTASPGDGTKDRISLLWLIRRMRKVVHQEVSQTPGTQSLRSVVAKWIGAVSVCLTRDELIPVLYNLAAPLVRERETADPDTELGRLVKEVTEVLKKKVGLEEYTRQAVRLQTKLLERRSIRRSEKSREFVTDPERAAKRKIDKQIKKKEMKKKKMEILKGKKAGKRKRKRKEEVIF